MIRSIAAAALALCTAGCAATIYTEIEPRRPAKAPVVAERVALLPVGADEGLEPNIAAIGDSLLAAAERAHPWVEFIPPQVTVDRLEQAGLAQRFDSLLIAYDQAGRFDGAVLRAVGQALGADHLLDLRVGYERVRERTQGTLNPAVSYEADRQNLYVTAGLWDLRAGDLAWEAVSTSTTRDAVYELPRSFNEVLAVAAATLAQQIPLQPTPPPAPAPPAGAAPSGGP